MKYNTTKLKVLAGILLLISSVFFVTDFGKNKTSEVLITFDNNNIISQFDFGELGISVIHKYTIISTIVANVPTGLIPLLEKTIGISSIQENFNYLPDAIPNDPGYSQLWGMDKISAPAAWDIRTDASSVIVAVIDTGVQITHPDLAANIWRNQGEIAGNAIDDDGNGFVDDVNGWDFASNDNTVYDGTSDDHGTHVSGTIGGVGNNGQGVTGVSWNVKIMPLKFLGASGGSTADAISAIEYATLMGADIISASWGGGGFDQALKNAIDAFPGLFVAAAGNDGLNNDNSPHYPSSYTSSNLIAVASTTSTDGMSSFSNYGVTSVDIGAPGSSIYSTWPSNTYNTISGTSMATPHVSGAAALVLAQDSSLTSTQLKAKLMDFSDPISSLSGKVVSGGRLNVYASLTGTAPPPPPPPPPSVTETFTESVSSGTPNKIHYFDVPEAGDISATLSWGTTADVDMYLYTPGSDPNGAGWVVRAYTTSNPESLAYSATQTGTWAVRVNLYSGVTSSYTLDVTHPGTSGGDTTPPSQVTGLSTSAISSSQINLNWNANTESDLSHYVIYRGGVQLTTSTSSSYSDTSLSASTSYSYQVSAVDTSSNEGVKSVSASATTQPLPDTIAPVVIINSPSGTISAVVQVTATITDNVGVVSADYRIDSGTWVPLSGTGNSWAANLDTTSLSDGAHTIAVRASDAANNVGSSSGSFSVDNSAPGGPVTDVFTGSVSSTTKNKIFYFDVGSSGSIDAILSWAGSTDLDMYLYAPGSDPNGASWVVRAYTLANPESMTFSATQTGTWAVRVNFYSGSAVSFSLSVTHPAGGNPPPGPITETFTGSVSSSVKNQIFYFDVNSAGSIDAILSWAGLTDLDMYLYAPGSDPNGASWVVRAYSLANPESMTFSATQTGTWAVRVNFYSGSAVSFSLSVTHP